MIGRGVMELEKLSKVYKVSKLTESDIDAILELAKNNDIFFRYNPPMFTRESIIEDMNALPPGKEMKDKFTIGFFSGNKLIAGMDLIRDYPQENIAYIGLFMMHAQYQGKGIGTTIISQVMDALKEMGCKKVRLAIDRGNPQSEAFWLKQGFLKDGEGSDKHIPMEKVL